MHLSRPRLAKLAAMLSAFACIAASTAYAKVESRFLLGAAAFEMQCLTPIRTGKTIAPSLKTAGEKQWWVSNGVILKAIESKKGQKGCQIYPSSGQRVPLETLNAVAENFDVWAKDAEQSKVLREYQNCDAFEDGTRRVFDTMPNLKGSAIRVVFQIDPGLSHFVMIAAETSVFTPPADCEPWES
ncbi:hypothetical protein LY10_01712 [Planktotalea frisia]|uniref:Uncharacterized protein n=1 Tax=Planktotalea frisia TaxID=696762 RepID=A0A1L9NWN6_9RHOB|nr:hypothetical protein PFRI_21410 [Planktotalea frisia]PZX29841.1 hypothetical protein LY10_01712 [Planktotalea frisia]